MVPTTSYSTPAVLEGYYLAGTSHAVGHRATITASIRAAGGNYGLGVGNHAAGTRRTAACIINAEADEFCLDVPARLDGNSLHVLTKLCPSELCD